MFKYKLEKIQAYLKLEYLVFTKSAKREFS
jgi:hypothetical protein